MLNVEHSDQFAKRSPWRRIPGVILAVGLIAFGLTYETLVHQPNAPMRYFCVTAGTLLLLRSFAWVVPARWRPSNVRLWRRVRRHGVRMPREVIVYLAIMIVLAAGSMLGHSNTLLLVFSLMAGPFVLNGWAVVWMLRRLTLEREVPRRVGAGETFAVRLSVRNARRFGSSCLMTLQDRIRNARESLTGRVLFFRIPPGSSRSAAYRVRLMQRGRYDFGPCYISSRFPFGLGERGKFFENDGHVLVHPAIGELAPAWKQSVLGAVRVVENQRPRSGTYDDEFRQIREYRSGDAVRNIHWRTSARMNELMVREFQQNRERDAVLLIDLWMPQETAPGENEHLESAASFTATVCHEISRTAREAEVGVFISAASFAAITGPASGDLWDRVYDELAVCIGSPEADLSRLLEESARLRDKQTRAVLLTTRPAEVTGGNGHAAANGFGAMAEELARLQVVHMTPELLEAVFRADTHAEGNGALRASMPAATPASPGATK